MLVTLCLILLVVQKSQTTWDVKKTFKKKKLVKNRIWIRIFSINPHPAAVVDLSQTLNAPDGEDEMMAGGETRHLPVPTCIAKNRQAYYVATWNRSVCVYIYTYVTS